MAEATNPLSRRTLSVRTDHIDQQCQPYFAEARSTRLRGRSAVRLPAWLLAVCLALTGCISSKMYRPVNIEQNQDYTLAIIEFDDQGELWAPSQVSRALDAIERANRSETGATLVIFVHGWNNNASEKHEQKAGYSLYEFKKFLKLIKDEQRQRKGSAPIMGVFIAWRGKSASGPFHPFTFWGRQRAATRIASGPSVVDAVTRIVREAKQNPKSKTLLIGHSFGGWITERSLSQLIVSGIAQADGRQLRGGIDLVLLVNPASPSLEAKQVIEVLARERIKVYRVDAQGNRFERPLLVSITSKGDAATRYLYPIGRSLGAWTSRFRQYGPQFCSPTAGQRGFYLYTPGHRTALHSHIVTAEPLPEGVQPSPGLRYVDDPESRERAASFDGEKYRFTLRRKPRALNDTPYWIARVPASLIPNHADVFNPNTLRFFTALLEHTGALRPDSTTVITHETGLRAIGLAVQPSGELLFLDRSRRVFALPKGSEAPVFQACFPPGFDPGDFIGGYEKEGAMVLIQNREPEKTKERGYRTEMFALGTGELVAGKVKPVRFEGEQRFVGATGDSVTQRAYLSTRNEIYVADLSRARPRPEPLLRIDTTGQLGRLRLDPAHRRLLVLDTGAGRLYIVDLTAATPEAQLAADGLGTPVDLELHLDSGRLYVSDPQGKQIWEITCQGIRCRKRVFVRSEALKAPAEMAISADGTLWVSDEAAGRLFAVSPDGTIKQTLSSLVDAH